MVYSDSKKGISVMNPRTLLISLPLLTLLAACGGPGESASVPEAQPAGATFADIGKHEVHFSAQTTDQLPPQFAQLYNIVRSKNRAMINVSVISKATDKPVKAKVSVHTVNLTGQLKSVTIREVSEGNAETDDFVAIYYIGETNVANRESLVFTISVQPEGVEKASEVKFQREFFTD
jgi:hypothetical protein